MRRYFNNLLIGRCSGRNSSPWFCFSGPPVLFCWEMTQQRTCHSAVNVLTLYLAEFHGLSVQDREAAACLQLTCVCESLLTCRFLSLCLLGGSKFRLHLRVVYKSILNVRHLGAALSLQATFFPQSSQSLIKLLF